MSRSLVSEIAPRLRVYLTEAAELGAFMFSACTVTVLLEHPASPLRAAIADAFTRRALIGLAMGTTAIALIYSPLGRLSGAHLNPCVTLTFYRLGKIRALDAAAYAIAHFVGGAAGVAAALALFGNALADPAVAFAVTVPGSAGTACAFAAEIAISFGLMTAVLAASNAPQVERYAGVIAGTLVALYITFEAPLSGMSMNPARTVASALFAGRWTDVWVYFAAPTLGMLAAAEAYTRLGRRAVHCAKLRHDARVRCIFCERAAPSAGASHPSSPSPQAQPLAPSVPSGPMRGARFSIARHETPAHARSLH